MSRVHERACRVPCRLTRRVVKARGEVMDRECMVLVACPGNGCMTVTAADGKLISACVQCANMAYADQRTVETANDWELSW